MNAATLIRELSMAGIGLTATGDRLHVDAPAGAITPELRQRITASKRDLLAHLHLPPTHPARAALLALANSLGIDRRIVHALPETDMALWELAPPESLRGYLLALADTATRQAGKVPAGDTAAICCAGCGTVYVHPTIAAVLPTVAGWPRALGCPWCAVRKAGGRIPRPEPTAPTDDGGDFMP